ncbi:MAG TPA: phosphate-starvation-inducible PsiE family protein [Acidimicrobiales bacterium]|nr:phosphate-starvation-inducible PsiE family protein [Acidimicrobiales bacterium]
MSERTGNQRDVTRVADRAMRVAEQVVYAAVGLLLMASAVVVLVAIGWELVHDLDGGAVGAVTGALDGLLLVFILVELLGAVRATVAERQIVAEPFLLVGIIASIKEIVVASLKAGHAEGEAFDDFVAKVALLGGVVLLLAISSYLVRLKEREPTEG